MKDFLKRKLQVGDAVVFLEHTSTSSALIAASIEGFTSCFVRVRFQASWSPFTQLRLVSPDKVVLV